MRTFQTLLVFLVFALTCTTASASSLNGNGLTAYSQDFEALDINSSIIGDGWRYFISVYEDQAFVFSYFGNAPNGPQISALTVNQGGLAQGNQQFSVYSDYECCAQSFGHRSPTGLGYVINSVFQEQFIPQASVDEQWTFSFDAKAGNIELESTAFAFLKVLNPSNGFSITEEVSIETTLISSEWARYSMSLTIGDWAGQLLQFGFQTTSGNFEGSGVFYDNIDFSPTAVPLPGALVFMLSGLLGLGVRRSSPKP